MAAEAATEPLQELAETVAQPVAAPPGEPDGKPAKVAKAPKKDGKGAAKKGKKVAKQPAVEGGAPNVAAHPRAARSVARVKSWCGLVGFLIGGYLSLPTSTVPAAGVRALIAGTVCYVAGWAAAVFVWRRIVMLEVRAREQELVGEALARHGALAPSTPASAGGPAVAARDGA